MPPQQHQTPFFLSFTFPDLPLAAAARSGSNSSQTLRPFLPVTIRVACGRRRSSLPHTAAAPDIVPSVRKTPTVCLCPPTCFLRLLTPPRRRSRHGRSHIILLAVSPTPDQQTGRSRIHWCMESAVECAAHAYENGRPKGVRITTSAGECDKDSKRAVRCTPARSPRFSMSCDCPQARQRRFHACDVKSPRCSERAGDFRELTMRCALSNVMRDTACLQQAASYQL
ncbi:hypothetical protein MVEN_00077900 [Mycena venus]|uniref:Uncharacterized protein n=1 Tax=Mycena venus TaxID=2733690 RepID=A0A8H6Z7H8_9AGAR|nr:hypothetical protein MVEN_00077900 [Mycena venus]